jgi:hypothetical protein
MLDALHRDGINLDMSLVSVAQLHHRCQSSEGGNLRKHCHHLTTSCDHGGECLRVLVDVPLADEDK